MSVSSFAARISLASAAAIMCSCSFSWREFLSMGPANPSEPVVVSATFLPTKDTHLDREDKEVGLASEMRLFYADAVGLLAFEGVAETLKGKILMGAELQLNGWTDREWSPGTGGAICSLEVFSAASDWQEGTGHWYWHGNSPHNGYASVYSLFPGYTPPPGATDPVLRIGTSWSTSAELRAGLVPIGRGAGLIPANTSGKYPLLENTGRIAVDLTEKLPGLASEGVPLGLAIRLAPRATPGGWAWIYSRNHVSEAYAPKLVLRVKAAKKA